MRCLCCKKELTALIDNGGIPMPAGGGEIQVRFDYGSRHDQCRGFSRDRIPCDATRLTKLLHCDMIVAFICDDCFEQNIDSVQGYSSTSTTMIRRVV